jgi:hypothetical protein
MQVLLGVLLLTGLNSMVFADEVSGFFRFKQDRADYTQGVAVRWADPEQPGAFKLGVILSNQALDAEVGRGATDPLDAIAATLENDAPSLRLTLDGEPAALTIGHLFSTPGGFNTSGDGEEVIAVADGRIKGSWKLPPKEFFDDTYEADFRFELALVDLKDPGTPLPAGGGDPGKAYVGYIAALAKGDAEGVKQALGESSGWRFAWLDDDHQRVRALEDEALHKPVKVTVLGGWIDGDRAQIKVEGPGRFGSTYRGRVTLQRESGAWKIAEQELN